MASKNEVYNNNKSAKVGEIITCPMCGNEFAKKSYLHAFCSGACKDAFWNYKGDRHKGNYYKNYNMIHPERLDRGFTKGCENGNLTDEIYKERSISHNVELEQEDRIALKRYGCKFADLLTPEQMDIIDEIVIKNMGPDE